jgi:predicted GIY-YIG superfamily endonuclease
MTLPKNTSRTSKTSKASRKSAKSDHHHVYVVYLRDPKGDGKAGYYVGMTGLSPERRFRNHKAGIKAARVVRKYGERLVPRLYAHLNPMPYARAKDMEVMLADSLRKRGFSVFGGH